MKRRSKIIVALAAICALGAVPTASASAAEAHWYAGGTILGSTATPITGTGTGTSSLTAVVGTFDVNITCTTEMTSAGSILNPTGGGMGTGSGIKLVFSGCTVDPTNQHCSVKGVTSGTDPAGTITTAVLTATAETGMKVKFSPPAGGNFVVIELSGCSAGGLNTTYPVAGTATGVEEATESGMLTFNGTSGSALTLGGLTATFTNTTDVTRVSDGAAVTIKEP